MILSPFSGRVTRLAGWLGALPLYAVFGLPTDGGGGWAGVLVYAPALFGSTLVSTFFLGAVVAAAVSVDQLVERIGSLDEVQRRGERTLGSLLSELAGLREEAGAKLESATLAELGRVRRIEIDKDDTTLIGSAGAAERIQARVAQIRKASSASPAARPPPPMGTTTTSGIAAPSCSATTPTPTCTRSARPTTASRFSRAPVCSRMRKSRSASPGFEVTRHRFVDRPNRGRLFIGSNLLNNGYGVFCTRF